jgi:glycosyltransferase involved in cell wall biosynthesis
MRILYPHTRSSIGGSLISTLTVALQAKENDLWHSIFLFPCEGDASKKATEYKLNTAIYKIPLILLKWSSYNTRSIRKLFSLPVDIFMIIRALKVIREYSPDIIHINDDSSVLVWGIAAKLLGVTTVWHIRMERRSMLLDRFRSIFIDVRIFLSESAFKKYVKFGNTRSYIIHNGIKPNSFKHNKAHYSKLSFTKEFRFLFIGNIVERKRPLLAIDVIKAIREKGYNVSLKIIGAANDKKLLKKIRKKISMLDMKWCSYFGFINSPQEFIKSSDALIITSTSDGEALPRSALEAHAYGLPVLTTNCGSIREIVIHEQTGFVVDNETVEELAEYGKRLVTNPQLCLKFSNNAKQLVIKKFSIDKVTKLIKDMYQEIKL